MSTVRPTFAIGAVSKNGRPLVEATCMVQGRVNLGRADSMMNLRAPGSDAARSSL